MYLYVCLFAHISGFLKSIGSRKPIEIAHLKEVCLITSSLQGSPKRSSYGGGRIPQSEGPFFGVS